MKIMRSTKTTSTKGVTLISASEVCVRPLSVVNAIDYLRLTLVSPRRVRRQWQQATDWQDAEKPVKPVIPRSRRRRGISPRSDRGFQSEIPCLRSESQHPQEFFSVRLGTSDSSSTPQPETCSCYLKYRSVRLRNSSAKSSIMEPNSLMPCPPGPPPRPALGPGRSSEKTLSTSSPRWFAM